jgi:hypothetical protein
VLTVGRILTCLIVTHSSIITSDQSRGRHRPPSTQIRTLLYHAPRSADRDASIASVVCLSPGYFRHHRARPVSCYALFKWWLLLSQHPGCLRTMTSFTTEHTLGTLADGLGSFPFDDEDYPPPSESGDSRSSIRSLIGFGNRVRPLAHSVLYPCYGVAPAYT